MTFDLIYIWRNSYYIFDPSLVVIGLFKGDPNNENLTKLEHTHTYMPLHTEGIRYRNIPTAFQDRAGNRQAREATGPFLFWHSAERSHFVFSHTVCVTTFAYK